MITHCMAPDYKELDGGQLDNSSLSLAEAGKEILAIHELPAGTMEPLTGDRLDDFLEATEQANAIPQPQAWNGIDGLLNGKPFMPEASPVDRAAALIELAEKNAPAFGQRGTAVDYVLCRGRGRYGQGDRAYQPSVRTGL